MSLNDDYRIRRSDKLNIAIEKRRAKSKFDPPPWDVISFHGNSPFSLVSGLLNIAMAQYDPKDENLLKQAQKIELELVSIRSELIKLIEDISLQGD